MKFWSKYIALLIAFLVINSLQGQHLQKVALQLKWKHQFQFAGYYAAIEKGYYKEVGIQVNLVEAVEGINPSDEVLNGNAEFGICASDILLLHTDKKRAVVLATIFQHSPQVLLASKQSGIEYVNDLIGKRIALEPNAADLIVYMNDEGVSLDKCIIDNHPFDTKKLLSGEIDAISAFSTDELFILQEAKFDYTMISPSAGGIDFYSEVLFTTDSLIEQNPKLATNFREASLKGWRYAMNHQDEIINLIYNKYTQRHSIEHLKFEADRMKTLIMPNVVEIGYTNRGRWESILEIYKKSKLIDASVTTKGLLYSDYIKPKMDIPWNLIGILVLTALVFGFIAFFFYNTSQKLKDEIKYRHKIETKLTENEERLSLALEGTSDGLWDWNINTNEVYFSPSWKSMLGYSEDELENNFSTWEKLIHPDDLQQALTYINEFLNKVHLRYESEFRMIHKNGESINILSRGIKQVNDKTGKLHRLVGTIVNITNIKNAEMQIRKLSVAIEQSPTTIVITDLNGKIEYANPKFTEMTGYTLEEATNNNPRILNSGKTEAKVYKELWETIKDGKTWHGEFINKKKNGEEFIEDAVIAPIFDHDGKINNYIAIKTDITASKEAEITINEQKEQLTELNATKDKFFSIIAHDLKSPFHGILGLSNLIVNAKPKLSLEHTMRYVGLINDASGNAYKLLENLLEWSSSQTGKIEFKPEKINLEKTLTDVMNLSENMAKTKNISLTNKIPDNTMVFADRNMLNTVLRNLISNAIKFTNKNGNVSVNAIEGKHEITVTVSDSGVGMDELTKNRLFKISEKVTTLGTEKEKGTGLGLVLCKEFIEKHNGNIWVESEPGKGSKFIFTLPVSS
jgi:PAS domain S-box-containing protein